MPGPLRPFSERAQAGPELLAAGAPLDLEVALLGLAAIMGEAEKGEFLGLLPASTRLLEEAWGQVSYRCIVMLPTCHAAAKLATN